MIVSLVPMEKNTAWINGPEKKCYDLEPTGHDVESRPAAGGDL